MKVKGNYRFYVPQKKVSLNNISYFKSLSPHKMSGPRIKWR